MAGSAASGPAALGAWAPLGSLFSLSLCTLGPKLSGHLGSCPHPQDPLTCLQQQDSPLWKTPSAFVGFQP